MAPAILRLSARAGAAPTGEPVPPDSVFAAFVSFVTRKILFDWVLFAFNYCTVKHHSGLHMDIRSFFFKKRDVLESLVFFDSNNLAPLPFR